MENIINAILDEIVAAMARGDRVELRGAVQRKRGDPAGVRAQVTAVLDQDPLLVFPAKLPKPDDAIDPTTLPGVRAG